MPRFARGAAPWLAVPAVLLAALAALAFVSGLGWTAWLVPLPALALGFFLVFFRDPERPVADGVACPADGKVVRLDQVDDADVGRADRLAVFMSPKDVHVNRFPLDGRVASVRHVPGGHIPAFNKDAHRNERVEWLLDTALGRVKVVQIAGTVARRIVPYHGDGHAARKGERMGLIRLGSRCDLLVPPQSVTWSVGLGQRVHAGQTSVGQPVVPAPPRARATARTTAATATAKRSGRTPRKAPAQGRRSRKGAR